MNKAKKTVLGFVIVAVLIIGILLGIYLIKANNNENKLEGTILFYRFDCPHCKIVEEFMDVNNVTSKIEITELEVTKPVNQLQIQKAFSLCKISEENQGVPLLYDDNQCFLGDGPIIEHFKTKLNITEVN